MHHGTAACAAKRTVRIAAAPIPSPCRDTPHAPCFSIPPPDDRSTILRTTPAGCASHDRLAQRNTHPQPTRCPHQGWCSHRHTEGINGIGKTTLAGLRPSDHGYIKSNRQHTTATEGRHFIAYMSHLPGLKHDLSALENLHLLSTLHSGHPTRTPDDAFAPVGLANDGETLIQQLPAGQKKRLILTRLWLSPTPLWLLDEPYAHLDPDGITLVNHMIFVHLHNGGGALLTTPDAHPTLPVPTHLIH